MSIRNFTSLISSAVSGFAHFSPQWVSQPGYVSLLKTGTPGFIFVASSKSSCELPESRPTALPGSDPASSIYGCWSITCECRNINTIGFPYFFQSAADNSCHFQNCHIHFQSASSASGRLLYIRKGFISSASLAIYLSAAAI